MGDIDRAVGDLDPGNVVFLEEGQIILELVPYDKGFEKQSAEIHRYTRVLEELYLFPEPRGEQGSAESELHEIEMGMGAGDQVAGLAYAKSFVIDHGQSIGAGTYGPLRDLSEVEVHRRKLQSKLQRQKDCDNFRTLHGNSLPYGADGCETG